MVSVVEEKPHTNRRNQMDSKTEVEIEKRELHRRYQQTRNALWMAIDQLEKLEEEYGFEYSATQNTLRELAKQLRVDETMANEMIESMNDDFALEATAK